MPHWKLKATIQRVLGWLPGPHFWNGLFQTYVTRSVVLTDGRFEHKLIECHKHLEAFQRFSPDPQAPFTAVDLGTGWHPVVPLGLFLCGGEGIWTFDITPLTTGKRVRTTLERLVRYAEQGKLQQFLPSVKPNRLGLVRDLLGNSRLRTPEELLRPLGIHLQIQDARQTGLPSQGIDLFVSVAVWGHIPEPILAGILSEFRRLASPRSVLSSFVDLADLYHFSDGSITPFNFLQFTEEEWKPYNNPIIPQNRLRIADYRRLLKAARFELVQETSESGKLEELQRVALAAPFRNYSTADLLVTSSWLTAQPG